MALGERLTSYSWWEVAVELLLIWIVVYAIVRFVQGTRAAGALKGLLVVLVVGTLIARVLGDGGAFERLTYLYDRVLGFVAIALLVVFQPELRRALIRLGEARWWGSAESGTALVVGEITTACAYLAKARFGALIVIERQIGLKSLTEGGTPIGGDLSSRLLQTIFYPGSALHDLAVIVRGGKVVSAGVQLPLAESAEMPDPSLGSRHRAAVGVTKESDALVVVVSEESGLIRIAERGRLSKAYDAEGLRAELLRRIGNEMEKAIESDAVIPEDASLGSGSDDDPGASDDGADGGSDGERAA